VKQKRTSSLIRKLRAGMTDAERELWYRLRDHRLLGEKFRRQEPVGPYIVDFVHFGGRLVVEVDGGQHLESRSDQERDRWFAERKFKVIRFWNDQVFKEIDTVLQVILDELGSPSPLAPPPQGGRGSNKHNAVFSPSPLAGEGLGRGGRFK